MVIVQFNPKFGSVSLAPFFSEAGKILQDIAERTGLDYYNLRTDDGGIGKRRVWDITEKGEQLVAIYETFKPLDAHNWW